MKSQIAVYDTHDKAVSAIKRLSQENFSMDHVSLLGKAEVIEDHIQVKSLDTIKKTPAVIGMGAGTLLGLLSGVGVFAIPGFGFLYGAGALVGIIAGLDLGLIAGGAISLLSFTGLKEEEVVKCQEHLKEGKFMVIVKGAQEEIERAKHILHTDGDHLEMIA
ncbi:DUF1269 domain-containing protein [Flavobacterium sp. HJJ]|uniref:DUF1269 domain-containing protein n=1 Tax=Flavobacterium sp. HJJ TaxID=2783792 RepID=UPI00188B9060|nr:DUF1269 domain-containing protein [Flavobacterium sp. HJJ]MBF4471257.1 DUF1269 domain-containing protein [Flavobacterium sp. HJJ]